MGPGEARASVEAGGWGEAVGPGARAAWVACDAVLQETADAYMRVYTLSSRMAQP